MNTESGITHVGSIDQTSGEPCLKGESLRQTIESTERISEIWFREPFPRWGFLRFRVRVSFTYG